MQATYNIPEQTQCKIIYCTLRVYIAYVPKWQIESKSQKENEREVERDTSKEGEI